ncbi:hypothetical protein JCM8097_008935 [Rhodosporidiobolus ruineniae]
MRLLPLLLPLVALPTALGWGAAGHEHPLLLPSPPPLSTSDLRAQIVATLAEIHLHPTVLAYIRASGLLPDYAHGHLAGVATWADRIRGLPAYRWAGQLHYTSWGADHPPDACQWAGENGEADDGGWKSELDVLHAIGNYSTRLEANPEDWESFRFLIHFLGDVHQPMHLTGRERGGNGDPVTWDGRRTNLHSLWDGLLIARTLREQRNYTAPLPSKQIESALNGAIYDPYIRLLVWEGIRSWYRTSLPSWLSCPSSPAHLSSAGDQLSFSAPLQSGLDSVVCPVSWATATHRVTCELAFPEGYDMDAHPQPEIGGNSEFWRKLKADHSLARLLLQGGLRLASVLNTVLAAPARDLAEKNGWVALLERDEVGAVNLGWLVDVE